MFHWGFTIAVYFFLLTAFILSLNSSVDCKIIFSSLMQPHAQQCYGFVWTAAYWFHTCVFMFFYIHQFSILFLFLILIFIHSFAVF